MNRRKGFDRDSSVTGKEQRWGNGLQLVDLGLMEMNEWWRVKCLKQNTAWHGGRRLKFVLDKKSICGPNSNRKCLLLWVKTSGSWDPLQTNWIRTSGKKDCPRLPTKLTPFQGLPATMAPHSLFLSFLLPPPHPHLLSGSPWKWLNKDGIGDTAILNTSQHRCPKYTKQRWLE